MRLKLLILLLLLVMRSSLLEKVDNHGNGDRTQRLDHVNFRETDLPRKKVAYKGGKEYLNISTILAPFNHRDRQVLVKKFLSDPRFKEFLNSERALNFLTPLLMKRKVPILKNTEKSDRKGKKLRTVSANELEEEVTVMNERKKSALSFVRTNSAQRKSSEVESFLEKRAKRQAQQLWIQKDFQEHDDILNFYAFIIKDEEVPKCGTTASKITNTRYFMCSGVVLTAKHVLTTANCIQYAYLYEHHITGDLAVLIGAVSNDAYVLKIKKYDMHPQHKNNAELKDYAVHNLAVITVSCNIPTEALVFPKLPEKYEDVSHLCCSNVCKILTVVQTPNNRHEIKLLDAKYIPKAEHDDTEEKTYSKRKRKRVTIAKKVKRENKIAPSSVLLNNEPSKKAQIPVLDETDTKNNTSKSQKSSAENDLLEQITKELMRGLFREKLNVISSNPPATNPQEIMRGFFRGDFSIDPSTSAKNNSTSMSVKQAKAITNFIKVIIEKAMSRILGILNEVKNRTSFRNLQEKEGDSLVENIAETVKDKVMKEIEGSLTPNNLLNNTLAEPSSKYVHCPPLGTPVILDNTLIGQRRKMKL